RDRAPENPRRARPAGRRARQAAGVRRHDRRGDRPRAGGVAAGGEAQLGLRPRLAGARVGRLRAQRLTSATKRAASSTTAFLFFPGPLCARISHYLVGDRQGKASRTMSEKGSSEKTIFLEALEISSAAEREAYLDSACRDDPQLRAGVEALLRANEEPQKLLDTPEAVLPPVDAAPERTGAVIGPYKLREQLGEGGMGVVFVAEQQQPVRRKVALKLIKPGMDTKQVLARFEAERQALALMDHPNIAKVLDGGTTPAG